MIDQQKTLGIKDQEKLEKDLEYVRDIWAATTMELFTSAALDQGGWVWLGLGWSGTYRGSTTGYPGAPAGPYLAEPTTLLRLAQSHLKLDSGTEKAGRKTRISKREGFLPKVKKDDASAGGFR